MSVTKSKIAAACPQEVAEHWFKTDLITPEQGDLAYGPETVKALLKSKLPAATVVSVASRLTNPESLGVLLEKERRTTVLDAVLRNQHTTMEAVATVQNPKLDAHDRSLFLRNHVDRTLSLQKAEALGITQNYAVVWWEAGRLQDLVKRDLDMHTVNLEGLPTEEAKELLGRWSVTAHRSFRISGVSEELLKWLFLHAKNDPCFLKWLNDALGQLPNGSVPKVEIPADWESLPDSWLGRYTLRGDQTKHFAGPSAVRNLRRGRDVQPLIEISCDAVMNLDRVKYNEAENCTGIFSGFSTTMAPGTSAEDVFNDLQRQNLPIDELLLRVDLLGSLCRHSRTSDSITRPLKRWVADQLVNGNGTELLTTLSDNTTKVQNLQGLAQGLRKAFHDLYWCPTPEEVELLTHPRCLWILQADTSSTLLGDILNASPSNVVLVLKLAMSLSADYLWQLLTEQEKLASAVEKHHVEPLLAEALLHTPDKEMDGCLIESALRGILQMTSAPEISSGAPAELAVAALEKFGGTHWDVRTLCELHTESHAAVAHIMANAFGNSTEHWDLAMSLIGDWEGTLQDLIDTVHSLAA